MQSVTSFGSIVKASEIDAENLDDLRITQKVTSKDMPIVKEGI